MSSLDSLGNCSDALTGKINALSVKLLATVVEPSSNFCLRNLFSILNGYLLLQYIIKQIITTINVTDGVALGFQDRNYVRSNSKPL